MIYQKINSQKDNFKPSCFDIWSKAGSISMALRCFFVKNRKKYVIREKHDFFREYCLFAPA